ncbi:single-stranded DNA-binding protein, partial [Patescibacteria group bacterium]|nr:single-stranded DNA-binding protein [Patescibacteria group bacterium]
NKLAELCAQLLSKGRKVYVEGRLQTRTWTGQDEVQRTTTEIVISDMIILDSKRAEAKPVDEFDIPEKDISELGAEPGQEAEPATKKKESPAKSKITKKSTTKKKTTEKTSSKERPKKGDDDDMPF